MYVMLGYVRLCDVMLCWYIRLVCTYVHVYVRVNVCM